ncbi:hypothetical protein [Rhodoferax sp.]|uniref:hypothetical protein n=1 Tax=Rhodoferax sp. TaxID=50421 RepID=UPI0025EB4173|nr:hypothetical protein [Rhodoferax sp.]
MSDDFDSLFDTPPTAAVPAAGVSSTAVAPTLPAPSTPEVAASAEIVPEEDAPPSVWIALYKPGADVQYEGEPHTVSHVHISRNGLFVRLKEKDGVVPAEKVNIPLTRMVLPMGAYQPSPLLLQAPLPPGPARTK